MFIIASQKNSIKSHRFHVRSDTSLIPHYVVGVRFPVDEVTGTASVYEICVRGRNKENAVLY